MQVPNGAERFTFPTPTSPPSSPDSVNGESSLRTSNPISTPLTIKKSNINRSEITPPDRAQHIKKHYITYTPPQPDLHSSETDDSDANSSSDEDDENESNVNDVDKDKDDDLDVDYNDGDDDYEYDDDD